MTVQSEQRRMTTQAAFAVLKGHVNAGQRIQMRWGSCWVINPIITGWELSDANSGKTILKTNSAFEIEKTIVNA